MEPTFQSILHLLAWNGYEDEAYAGSQACKETWEDDRIYRKVNRLLGARKTTMIGIHTYHTKGSLERVKRMVRLGANPDLSNGSNSFTPLMDLCLEGDHYKMDIFEYILSLNVRVDGVEGFHWCPLSLLATIGTGRKKIEMLLQRGANVNRLDANGRSVLYMICMMDGYSIPENIDYLCDRGADVHLRDKFGQTALDVCLEYNYPTWTEALIKRGAVLPEEAMDRALNAKHKETVELLLRLKFSIPEGAILGAIAEGDDEKVKLLIDLGVSIYDYGMPLLVRAIQGNITQKTVAIVKHLCSAGSKVNERWPIEAYSPMTLDYRIVDEPVIYSLVRQYIIRSNQFILDIINILIDYGAIPPPNSEYDYIYPFSVKPLQFSGLNNALFRGRYATL